MTQPDDFRAIVRRGGRVSGEATICYVRSQAGSAPVRFGFIVGRGVGNAVRRNLVRRRLRAAGRELLNSIRPGTDIVVRALPAAADSSWTQLRAELQYALEAKGVIG